MSVYTRQAYQPVYATPECGLAHIRGHGSSSGQEEGEGGGGGWRHHAHWDQVPSLVIMTILSLLNIRKKKKAFDFVKVLLKYAFSQAGIIVLCIVYAVVGAEMYMSMEVPLEDQQKQLKMNAALVEWNVIMLPYYFHCLGHHWLYRISCRQLLESDAQQVCGEETEWISISGKSRNIMYVSFLVFRLKLLGWRGHSFSCEEDCWCCWQS